MTLQPGQTLLHYRLVEQIGEGGMGVVWKGIDTSLEREVAIKILPDEFAWDPGRRARFAQEAKLLASLNHPNIAAIYGLHDSDGVSFLAMEFLKGQDLAQRLHDGPLPIDEALETAAHIGDALEAAHGASIVHRDLKPANIHLGADGQVKVLDFGLAKVSVEAAGAASSDLSLSPTVTSMGTALGTIIGTASYMSPEQARGKPVDHRTDIWAFGCVFYEMLTGRTLFTGETATDILAAVIGHAPDWSRLPAAVPLQVRHVLERCLEKDVRRRLHHIADARLEITDALAGKSAGTAVSAAGVASSADAPTTTRARWRERLAWSMALVAGIALLVLIFGRTSPFFSPQETPRPGSILRFAVAHPRGFNLRPVVSPDGRHIAFVNEGLGRKNIWLRSLDRTEAQLLDGTAGAGTPFWSPDSRFLAFFAGGKLKRVGMTGAPPVTIADVPGGWVVGTWASDGTILFEVTETQEIEGWYLLPAGAQTPRNIRSFDLDRELTPDKLFPYFLPDGKHFLFTEKVGGTAFIHVGSLDSDETRQLVPGDSRVEYASGHLIYVRAGKLLAQPFDAEALAVTGEPVQLVEQVDFFAPTGQAHFSVSQQGTLIYRPPSAVARTMWVDREGRELATALEPGRLGNPRISADGRRMAVERTDPRTGAADIWVTDIERDLSTRLTTHIRGEFAPMWSPDGSRLLYSADWNGPPNLYLHDLDSGEVVELVPANRQVQRANDWSGDGRYIVFSWDDPVTGRDIWTVDLEGDRLPEKLIGSSFQEGDGRISPDGRWLVHVSSESGRAEIYVRPFMRPGAAVRVSRGGGLMPRWGVQGTKLFFKEPSGPLLAVSIETDGTGPVRVGKPQPLFDIGDRVLRDYEVHPDGKRFLLMTTTWDDLQPPFEVLVNWPRLLESR